jgi:hypothetical protein
MSRFVPLRMGFNTAWSLGQIVSTQNSRTCKCWWRYFLGTRIAGLVRHSAHVEEDFAMKVTLPARSEQECRLHEIDLRRDARKVVGLRTIVADKLDLARGEVTNISPGGCGLRLTKRLRCGQYITLLVYPNDRTAAVRIDLARVNWVKGEWAGVEFLGVIPQNQELRRLCGDQLECPLET